jgi:hypothetical protein
MAALFILAGAGHVDGPRQMIEVLMEDVSPPAAP